MVGREAAMAAADAAISTAAAGAGGLLLISGDPGIGKSCFVQAVAERATGRGLQPGWGYAVDDAGAPALWPWQRACRSWPDVMSALRGPDGGASGDARTSFAMFVDVCERISEVTGREACCSSSRTCTGRTGHRCRSCGILPASSNGRNCWSP